MVAIAPQTDVYLLKVPLEIDEVNQLTFNNAEDQYHYFNSLPKLAVDNYTYQRKDGTIRFGANFDSIIGYNYVMYRNDAYSNKWFYAFITGMEYLNDNVTAITIKTDVWQTWCFDLSFKRTFVEREHVNDDTIGSNTIDEGLEVGEYIINATQTLAPDKVTKDGNNTVINWKLPIVFQVSELAGGVGIASSAFDSSYNNVFSGLYYFAVTSYANARDIISRYANAGKSDAIVAIFLAPKEFFAGATVYGDLGYNIYIPHDSGYASILLDSTVITRPTKIDGYTPRNKKLFVYPFSYVYVTNNAGIDTVFKYEDFTNANPEFYISGALGQGCNVKLLPVNYKHRGNNLEVFDYGVTGAKYPICAWASDYYTNWVTQNAANVGLNVASGMVSAATNASFGNQFGVASSLLSSVGGVMAERYQAKVQPDQARGNTNCSDLLPSFQKYYTLNCMCVRSEVARSIDDYFSMFGYKVNRVKIPNITGRRNWNYVKTIGCYIDGDVPQTDMQEIKDMFNNGVTFWHNASTFADYSQNNDII